MAKVNVSLPDELLERIDALAAERGDSRSGFVQEASAHYIADLDAERERQAREQRIGTAIEQMREVSSEVGDFDGTEAIRRDRDCGHRESS